MSPRNWPRLLRAGLPLGLVTVLYVLLLRLDMSLLGFLAGAREVGIYGAAFRLFEATMFVSWAFVGAMAPWLARSAALAPSAVANGMTLAVKTLLAALLPLGVGLAVFAAPIIGLLYGDGYDEAVAPLRVLAVVVVAYGLNELAAALLVNRDRPRRFLVVLGPVIVLNVALNVALLPTYGALAAAWISAACGVVLLLAAAREVRAVTGRLGWTRAALGPGLAGAAMAAVGLLAPGPWPVAALLAGVTYAGVLAGWELRFHAGDADALRSALGRRPVEAATSPV